FPKISPLAMKFWAALLNAAPNSRLVIKAKSLADESTRAIARRMLESHGVARDRVEIGGWTSDVSDHLARYNDIDIALDTFPYNGTTTTCEALWMGVPVVTCAGQTHVSRVGASLLNAIGLSDLVAENEQDWLQLANSPQRRR